MHECRPGREQAVPAVDRRRIDQQRPAVVAVALAGEAPSLVEDGGSGVQHGGEAPPGPDTERMVTGVTLSGCQQAELGDECVVLRGLLAVEAAREGIAIEFVSQQRRRCHAPLRARLEPIERAAGDELPGRLGDHVVVGR